MKLRFDEFEIDTRALELRRGEDSLSLAPMAVRILIHLVERAGTLVERSEFYERFWPEGFVDRERLLNTYVRQIRAALGERAGENRFIRTFPRRGYRWVCPVADGTGPATEKTTADPARVAAEPARSVGRREWARAGFGRRVTRRAVGFLGAVAVSALALALPVVEGTGNADPTDPDARIAYGLGMELLEEPALVRRARAAEHFRAAVALDPDFAAAHSGLAESLFWAGDSSAAEAAARIAIRLDAGDARAALVLGMSTLNNRWAWDEAETLLDRAVGAEPDNPDARLALAYLLLTSGRVGEARAHLDTTRLLEPTAARITGDLGLMYGWMGEDGLSLMFCERTVAVEPEAVWGHECALDAARALGMARKVAIHARALVRLHGGDADMAIPADADMDGQIRALRHFQLERAAPGNFFWRALRLMALDRREEAVAALESSVASRETGALMIGVHPHLRRLASDSRYQNLVRRVVGARS